MQSALAVVDRMLKRIDAVLSAIENVCGVLAALSLGAIMLIVASDVGLRYLAGRPWPWAYDVVSIYLTVAVFYLALSRTLREHGHISVDLLRPRMSIRLRNAFDLLICVLSAAFFAIIAVLTTRLALSQYEGSEVISSYVDWPTWISTLFVPIGTALIILRIAVSAIGHVIAIVSGKEPLLVHPAPQSHHSPITGE
jgi:TRAP-type C4-dicarboxylate transport system permease small subunit